MSVTDAPLQIIITPVEGTEKDHMAETVADNCPSLNPPYVAKVPMNPPLTRKQYEESVQYWPTNFHEDKKWVERFEPPHDKTNKVTVHPAKTQISVGICPVWSEPSLCAQWVAKDPSFLHADSKDSDQTGWMPRLIWVFPGRTVILLVLSWHSSFFFDNSV